MVNSLSNLADAKISINSTINQMDEVDIKMADINADIWRFASMVLKGEKLSLIHI